MKTATNRKEIWTPATEFYKSLRDRKKNAIDKNSKLEDSNLLLRNLLKTNLQLLKSLDLSNTVLF